MRYFFLLYVSLFFLFCKNEKAEPPIEKEVVSMQSEVSEVIKPDTVEVDSWDVVKAYVDRGANDTLRIESDNEICFNVHIDSLVGGTIYEIQFIDLTHSIMLWQSDPMMNTMCVEKVDSNTYSIFGYLNFSDKGSWDMPFNQHLWVKYVFEVIDKGYVFYRDTSVHIKLESNSKRLAQLERYIASHKYCLDWEKADSECFKQIKRYEYYLFAAAIEGDKGAISKYMNLFEKVPTTYTGAVAQYIVANQLMLVLYRLAKPDQGAWMKLRPWSTNTKEYCL